VQQLAIALPPYTKSFQSPSCGVQGSQNMFPNDHKRVGKNHMSFDES
jgi:hypothetical protein